MTDWIEHDGGPQPVAGDVMVEVCATVDYTVNLDDGLQLSQFAPWARKFKYRILNQHLIDAARLEGIRLGLEAAAEVADHDWPDPNSPIRRLDPETIAREAKPTA
jgi:hypothetical protein